MHAAVAAAAVAVAHGLELTQNGVQSSTKAAGGLRICNPDRMRTASAAHAWASLAPYLRSLTSLVRSIDGALALFDALATSLNASRPCCPAVCSDPSWSQNHRRHHSTLRRRRVPG